MDKNTVISVGENLEKLEPSRIAWGMENGVATVENSLAYLRWRSIYSNPLLVFFFFDGNKHMRSTLSVNFMCIYSIINYKHNCTAAL